MGVPFQDIGGLIRAAWRTANWFRTMERSMPAIFRLAKTALP